MCGQMTSPADWEAFAEMTGAARAALTGLLFVAGGTILACGEGAGLYFLLPASLVAFISGVVNAWHFLLPPSTGRPARDSEQRGESERQNAERPAER